MAAVQVMSVNIYVNVIHSDSIAIEYIVVIITSMVTPKTLAGPAL